MHGCRKIRKSEGGGRGASSNPLKEYFPNLLEITLLPQLFVSWDTSNFGYLPTFHFAELCKVWVLDNIYIRHFTRVPLWIISIWLNKQKIGQQCNLQKVWKILLLKEKVVILFLPKWGTDLPLCTPVSDAPVIWKGRGRRRRPGVGTTALPLYGLWSWIVVQ